MSEALIEARGLTKRFGDFTAVAGIDVTVNRGESFGFLGPNGAGKSSTMRMIGCTSPRTDGDLRILGMDPAADGSRIRARLGVVPQEDTLDTELTVLDNLLIYGRYFDLPRKVIKQRAAELLEFAQLTDRGSAKVQTLSGGMKRRLTIARALINEPEVLLLDEPTTGLDPRSRTEMWGVIQRLVSGGTTLLLTTQYLEEADVLADRIAVIDRGTVIAEGTAAELKTQMGATVLEVSFADAAAAEAGLGTVASVVAGAEVDGHTVHAPVADGAHTAMEVLRAIDAAGLEVGGLTVREPSLDDVFLQLTGHRAEDAPQPDLAPAGGAHR